MQLAAACPACGGALGDWCSVPSSEPALGQQRFTLRRCVSCGSAVTGGDPVPELHDSGAYRAGTPRLHRLALPIMRAFDDRRLAMLSALVAPPARLADAGAGRGRFVIAARRAGYDAFGIEPSVRGAGAAEAIGAPIQRTTIASATVAERSLDAVTMWHVLEHLDDPGAAISQVASWLRPGGALLLGVPNVASLQARLGSERWFHFDVPRHRVHLTPAGVHALLRARGFHVVRTHHLLIEHNPFGMWQSLVSRATRSPSYLYNLLKRNASLRSPDLAITAAALPLAPVAMALEFLAGVARRGGTIAVLAQRDG